jgi:hypothetical protein
MDSKQEQINSAIECSLQPYPEEGFTAGTLIRTPNGYKTIETITEEEYILDHNALPKQVLKVSKKIVHRHIRLTINHENIYVGYEQRICLPYNNMQWCTAHNLQAQDDVLDAQGHMQNIEQYEVIPETIMLYQLLVKDHTFCIGPSDIIVHNADIAIADTTMLFLEYITYTNPVIAIVGSTVALSTIFYKAYQSYQQGHEHAEADDAHETDIPKEVLLAERNYYEHCQLALTKLRDEFASIYCGITAIRDLFHPQSATFSSQFLQSTLKHHMPVPALKISIAEELKLSDKRKAALRKIREQELELLEKEINKLHAMLVVHFDGLVGNVFDTHKAYDDYASNINSGIAIWNNNKHALTDQVVSESYEKEIIEECLIHDIQQQISELNTVVIYYQRNKSLISLQQSSNIIEQLGMASQLIAETKQWAQNQLINNHKKMTLSENYFAKRQIPTTGFKNQIKSAFNKEKKKRDTEALKNAQNKLDTMDSGTPKKDDDNDQDDFFKKLKSRSDKHVRTNKFGKMYRDPITGLWWAKDLARHGGSCYKVFKETATAFEWVFNADSIGNQIIGQHKSQIGMRIPFKDVIFKS